MGFLNIPLGSRVTTPDQAPLAVGTGTIDIRCEVAPTSWAAVGRFQTLYFQQNRVEFYINPDGTLELSFTHTGPVNSIATSTVATGLSAGTRKWVRVLQNVSAGTCDFFTSPDGSAFTSLGTQITGLLTTTENAGGGAAVSVGYDAQAGDEFVGKVYTTRVLVSAATIINMDWTTATLGTGPWVSGTGETWTAAGSASVTNSTNAAGSLLLLGVGA